MYWDLLFMWSHHRTIIIMIQTDLDKKNNRTLEIRRHCWHENFAKTTRKITPSGKTYDPDRQDSTIGKMSNIKRGDISTSRTHRTYLYKDIVLPNQKMPPVLVELGIEEMWEHFLHTMLRYTTLTMVYHKTFARLLTITSSTIAWSVIWHDRHVHYGTCISGSHGAQTIICGHTWWLTDSFTHYLRTFSWMRWCTHIYLALWKL